MAGSIPNYMHFEENDLLKDHNIIGINIIIVLFAKDMQPL